MKNLDDFEKVINRIEQTDLQSVLFPHEWDEWSGFSDETKKQRLKRICTVPLCNEDFTAAYSLYFRLKWLDVFRECIPQTNATVLEVGSGSSANIPNALTIFDTSSTYITANMNKKLTAGLRQNTAFLPIKIKIIEDDANNIKDYLEPNSVDAVVFEHSVNDVIQAILCESKGIDTTNSDWFEILPEMINIINSEYAEKMLERSVKNAFLSLLEDCLSVLKPGGYMIMSHYMFQYDLDLGYNPELWQYILPVVRPWLSSLSCGKEVAINPFDPQWWLFYQK